MTSENKRQLPVMDVDQAFPLLTTDGAGARPAATSGIDQAPTVANAIREVLGWRPRVQDPKAFAAALNASFELHTVEGHVEARYVARGFAMQADLGGITGGQASLYWRAKSAHEQITRMLESLQPLRPDADPEDCAAFRALVRDTTRQIVQELGLPGGPRVPLVDSAFRALTGFEPTAGPDGVPADPLYPDRMTGGTDLDLVRRGQSEVPKPLPPAVVPAAGSTVDDVPGILGALRDRFGLTDDNVNTVDEEKVRTSFLTLVDLVIDLQRSWNQQRVAFGDDVGRGFLGTELILINRLLAAAAEQVDELEAVLDSALVSAAERQTVVIDPATRLTLDGLLGWLRTFLTEDGPRTVQDMGRDGITTWFTPTVLTLLTTVREKLVMRLPVGGRGGGPLPISLLPVGCCSPLPAGMYAARTRIAVSGLCGLLEQLARNASRIGRFTGVVLFDLTVSAFAGQRQDRAPSVHFVRVEVRGLHLRPSYLPAFLRAGRPGRELADLVLPVQGSASAGIDSLVAVFRAEDVRVIQTDLGVLAEQVVGLKAGQAWTVPASAVPLAVVDGETGRVVTAPPVRTWPLLTRADGLLAADIPDEIGDTAQVFVGSAEVPDDGLSDLPDPDEGPDEGPDEEVEGFGGAGNGAVGRNGSRSARAVREAGEPTEPDDGREGLGVSGADRLAAARERVRTADERTTAADDAWQAERQRSEVVRRRREEMAAQVRELTEQLRLADGLLAEQSTREDRARTAQQVADARARRARDEELSARLLAEVEGGAPAGAPPEPAPPKGAGRKPSSRGKPPKKS